MRGLKDEPVAHTIIDGFRVYSTSIRPHMAPNGKTPAEMANIDLGLEGNKWLELIQKAHSN